MSNQDPNFQRMSEILHAGANEAAAFGLSQELGDTSNSYEKDIEQAMQVGNDNGAGTPHKIEVTQVASNPEEETVEVNGRPGGRVVAAVALGLVAVVGIGAANAQRNVLEEIKNQTTHTVVDGPTIGQNPKGGPVVIRSK
ncbi:hypothetical protein KC976_03380 [Candidatus Saccharibacteria bacterium]|nr:hypothetical protein [Candidatus Saccharibacteria bacterium]